MTIKTLFGEASHCAYPNCNESLIFRDRDKTTPVAEIAHIRSEAPSGPRHDPVYTKDINGADNLLLLCGKHHRPVDRHESVYTVAELQVWKAAQRAGAGNGTSLTESDVRAYARLSDDERAVMIEIARLVQRLVTACVATEMAIAAVRAEEERARLKAQYALGPIYEVHEDGTEVRSDANLELSWMEQQAWAAKVVSARAAEMLRVRQALDDLDAELSVLRMISPSLTPGSDQLRVIAVRLAGVASEGGALTEIVPALEATKSRLWRLANGVEEHSIGS